VFRQLTQSIAVLKQLLQWGVSIWPNRRPRWSHNVLRITLNGLTRLANIILSTDRPIVWTFNSIGGFATNVASSWPGETSTVAIVVFTNSGPSLLQKNICASQRSVFTASRTLLKVHFFAAATLATQDPPLGSFLLAGNVAQIRPRQEGHGAHYFVGILCWLLTRLRCGCCRTHRRMSDL